MPAHKSSDPETRVRVSLSARDSVIMSVRVPRSLLLRLDSAAAAGKWSRNQLVIFAVLDALTDLESAE